MFVADTITAWVEAFEALFHDPTYPAPASPGLPDLRDIPVLTDYPQEEINYPGLWVNFTMQGDVKNVGIGHVEYETDDDGTHEVYRWHYGGFVEITIGAMSNLERALLLDEVTKAIAVARVDKNREGALRAHVERNDLIGMTVTWESITISGFGEAQGTPWGTDDIIYEATITLTMIGEVVLNPLTGTLVPLTAVSFDPQVDTEGLVLPTPGTDGWV